MPTHSWDRSYAPAAPALTDDDLCSECDAPAKPICKGEVKVCSKCLAVLWHSTVAETRRQTPHPNRTEVGTDKADGA
jgi:hypothetical protein